MTSGRVGASPVGIGEARGYRGTRMSAGHSLRRQNYSFVTITPPVVANTELHLKRVLMAVVTAVALDLATFATISSLIR
jgi:hypothetical protein